MVRTIAQKEAEMVQRPTPSDGLRELERQLAEAETQADVATLDAIATQDFTLVGPAGFVLGKSQWLDRYREGALVTRSLALEDTTTRFYGDTAVTIGRHVQRAEYQGRPANGEFRATHIAVSDRGQWRLAGIHLSPIGGPPPFAQRQAPGSGIASEPAGG
jgi:ketosteroid isomerase-like protein